MSNPIGNDINHLHQLILNLAARLQSTEAIANAAISLACAADDKRAGQRTSSSRKPFRCF
ncbi:hypothetical protein HED49_20025 [Ochrobactrum daejeonense]|nr:hypothetical protein [Brucella daejeonensis]